MKPHNTFDFKLFFCCCLLYIYVWQEIYVYVDFLMYIYFFTRGVYTLYAPGCNDRTKKAGTESRSTLNKYFVFSTIYYENLNSDREQTNRAGIFRTETQCTWTFGHF